MQQAAATTLAGKDADRIASFRACAFQLTDLSVKLAPALPCDPNRGGFGWQCTFNEDQLAVVLSQTGPIEGEIFDLQRQLVGMAGINRHPLTLPLGITAHVVSATWQQEAS